MKRLILILFLCPILMYSQMDSNRISLGLFGNYGLNIHSADFKQLPSCPSCSPGFTDGNGNGLGVGLVLDIPLFNKFFLSNKLFYKGLNGTFNSDEATTLIVNNEPLVGEFRHTLDATINVVGFEPAIKFNVFNHLFFNVGFAFSYLLTKDYSHIERIIFPKEYGTFVDEFGNDTHSRERHKFSGSLDDNIADDEINHWYLAPMLSVSYRLPLNSSKSLFLEPEIAYHLGINDIISHELVNKWKINSLSFGTAIKYSPLPKAETIEKFQRFERFDTVFVETDLFADTKFVKGTESAVTNIEKAENIIFSTEVVTRTDTIFSAKQYALEATISIVGIDNSGNEVPNPVFRIEEFVFNRLDPLLNYIFFDADSYKIPDRYNMLNAKGKDNFKKDSLFQISTIEIYYNILNIIAERMHKYPKANMTLIGCNADFGNEKGNTELSEKRALEVKNYLVNIWGVNEKRIAIKNQNLPNKASTPINEQDKIEENRRVEILSDDFRIIEPVFIENIQRTSNPPIARFKTNVNSDAGIKSWELVAYQNAQNDEDAFFSSGKANPPRIIDWKLEQEQLIVPKLKMPVKYQLSVTDLRGQDFKTRLQQFNIDLVTISDKRIQKVEDYEIEKFSLILFDFDKHEIEGSNREIINNITERIKQESLIEIRGFTDRTGEASHNQRLSERRADAAKNAIGRKDAQAIGVGMSELLYDNNKPEGRFYCRTVEVTVKTKIK